MTDLNKGYKVPFLPTELPFAPDQQQWLGGFLAGLHSRLLVTAANSPQAQTAVEQKPITIIYGTQTGNAEAVAFDCAELATAAGLLPIVLDMDDVEVSNLASVDRLIIVTSTYGEGEMPDNAVALWEAISADDAPRFEQTNYSVLALGDTGYDDFCLSGKLWDDRLHELGGKRLVDRVDCDVDYDSIAEDWSGKAIAALSEVGSTSTQSLKTAPAKARKKSKFNRKNPLLAELKTKRVLTGENSSKEIVHYEFSLSDSGETYDAGDALNVIPFNQDSLIQGLLDYFHCKADEACVYNDESINIGHLFREELEIRMPPKAFVKELAVRAGDDALTKLVEDKETAALNDFLYGKDTVDLLNAYPQAKFNLNEFISYLKPIVARAYSISSSINHHSEEVHLTISSIRYSMEGRDHLGVCSTYLADILELGGKAKCYFSSNLAFSVPEDNEAGMIMVGPGTGIAPFRGFLEERQSRSATGKNWLFFGDRTEQDDFIYQDELEAMQDSGLLTRLDLAFSRDQKEKIYVQDRIKQQGAEVFTWLEKGAFFFVCGDAYYMAKDVDAALHEIIMEHGNMDMAAAEKYVNKLKKSKHYVRDVY